MNTEPIEIIDLTISPTEVKVSLKTTEDDEVLYNGGSEKRARYIKKNDKPEQEKSREKTPVEELGNTVLVGGRNKPGYYAGLVKNLFAADKYAEIELMGRGEMGVMRVS